MIQHSLSVENERADVERNEEPNPSRDIRFSGANEDKVNIIF